MSAEFDLVIIGAGAAGVGAARRLAGENFSVLALEAAPRVGGRVFTTQIKDMHLDFGAEWLHSAARNPWTDMAGRLGFALDRRRANWWMQYKNLGFSVEEQAAAGAAYAAWSEALAGAPGDCAAKVLAPESAWSGYIRAIAGYVSGAELEAMSARDYAAYDEASTSDNWRIFEGFGALTAAAWPEKIPLRLATAVTSVTLPPGGVALSTRAGRIFARTVVCTVSTDVLAGVSIRWPREFAPWREAAAHLPLGRNEKLFFEILDDRCFEADTHLIGDPRDPATAAYDIRPFGRPVIECFLGGASALAMERDGPASAFSNALDALVRLFGADVRRALRPLVATHWGRDPRIGGAYSYALPGCAGSREKLARPFEDRFFFAGEATDPRDFTAAHGAYASGWRAAEEALAALARRR
ncbi:NAD(P)-binding protein [Rhodoblastus acidophilus]|uniref:Tryptophan 2-monooxygenase n=1 Tax=Rhodoblastus acidophilus TaxID=1074 RepID=A0A6N8DN35_RHOAC|nr:FAD-dependent oxidoreductase [Rhodoblastus acidophilus]MCW2275494.1 monoamine oxidase [Rhodoblastus acidophilus]MTV31950.1 NAD(P)-binding protein [Rhodoblastus acidophilus]